MVGLKTGLLTGAEVPVAPTLAESAGVSVAAKTTPAVLEVTPALVESAVAPVVATPIPAGPRKSELSEWLTNSLQCTEDVKQEKEALEARNDTLSTTVKEVECKLCEAQHMSQQKKKEMIDELSRLQAEKVKKWTTTRGKDKEGGFVVLPHELYTKKAKEAVDKNFISS
ncbi:hypothetical protein HPB47_010463, partial [Ixodes persulcatus]